jgi:hypothetical protein
MGARQVRIVFLMLSDYKGGAGIYTAHRLQSTTTTTTLLTARVGWNWGDVLNSANSNACTGQRTQSRLSTWTRSLGSVATSGSDLDVHCCDANFLHSLGNILGGKHSCVWGGFVTIGLDLHATGHSDDGFPGVVHMNEGGEVRG